MEQIIKKDGKVYLVKEMDVQGRHITMTYLGLDPDYIESKPIKEEKSKIKAKKKETDK